MGGDSVDAGRLEDLLRRLLDCRLLLRLRPGLVDAASRRDRLRSGSSRLLRSRRSLLLVLVVLPGALDSLPATARESVSAKARRLVVEARTRGLLRLLGVAPRASSEVDADAGWASDSGVGLVASWSSTPRLVRRLFGSFALSEEDRGGGSDPFEDPEGGKDFVATGVTGASTVVGDFLALTGGILR